MRTLLIDNSDSARRRAPESGRVADYLRTPMRTLLLLALTIAFFAVGLYTGGFAAIVLWGMAAGSFLMAID